MHMVRMVRLLRLNPWSATVNYRDKFAHCMKRDVFIHTRNIEKVYD